MVFKSSSTRGSGLFENLLSDLRAKKANNLIPLSFRKGKILDIGCGSFPYFLNYIDFSDKYGIDPSLKNTDFGNIKLKKLDISNNKLPFADNFFSCVTMLAVFEHIEEKKISFLIKEIKRVLKKEGILIITTPSPWSDGLLHAMARFNLISGEEIHDHKSHYGMNKIKSILKDAGFNKIEKGYFELGFNMWFKAVK